jgi:hypothetical protein
MPYDPSIPLLDIYLKEYKTIYKRDTCITMFIAVLFPTAKWWNWTNFPTIDNA